MISTSRAYISYPLSTIIKWCQFGIISQSKCFFCELYDETLHHIFYECTYAQNLWNRLRLYLSEKVALPVLIPQSAIFGFTDVLDLNFLLVNHLLLIFKYSIYNSRVNNSLSFQSLKCDISQIKYIEETIIIIISAINAILEGKEKATEREGGLSNKTVWTCLYACYLYNNFFVCLFVFWSFSCKMFFFRIYNCVFKFDENKSKNLLKKRIICFSWYLKLFLDLILLFHNLMQPLLQNENIYHLLSLSFIFSGFVIFFFFIQSGESIYDTSCIKFILWHL